MVHMLEKSPTLSKCNDLCKKRSAGAVLLCDHSSLWLHKLLAAVLRWTVHEALEKRIDFQNSLGRNENEFINKDISIRGVSNRPIGLFSQLNTRTGRLLACSLSSHNHSHFTSVYVKKTMPYICAGYWCRRVWKDNQVIFKIYKKYFSIYKLSVPQKWIGADRLCLALTWTPSHTFLELWVIFCLSVPSRHRKDVPVRMCSYRWWEIQIHLNPRTCGRTLQNIPLGWPQGRILQAAGSNRSRIREGSAGHKLRTNELEGNSK